MTWIRSSPFLHGPAPVEHMLLLISSEAEAAGIPLSDDERKILTAEVVPERPVPENLRDRVKSLVSAIIQRERASTRGNSKIGFLDALEWVEPDYPNIAALAEEVITGGGLGALPQSHGGRWVRDRAQLVGCALALVIGLAVVVLAISFLLGHK